MTDIKRLTKAWEIFRDSNPYQICDGKEFRAIKEPEYCMGQMIDDTLALLKEQEPVAHATWLCEETSTAYDLYGVKTWAAKYKCSKCGSVHRAIEAHMCYSYCPMCGARMDEDAKEGET